MAIKSDLLDAIRASSDDGPLLVYADWLLKQGDERGELIVLEHRERTTPGGITDRGALDRLLLLAARHGFPRIPDDPDAVILPFVEDIGMYRVRSGIRTFQVRYRGPLLAIDDDYATLFSTQVDIASGDDLDGVWSDEETNVILAAISVAIRAAPQLANITLAPELPRGPAMRAHPYYRAGPFPTYDLPGEFLDAHQLDPELGIAARDKPRWFALWARRCELG